MSRHEFAGAPADPGLQEERTRLAWYRTALAITAVAAVLARSGSNSASDLMPVAPALLTLFVVRARLSSARRSITSSREPAFSFLPRDGATLAVVAASLIAIGSVIPVMLLFPNR